MLTVKDVPSPNFDTRRSPPDMLVLHYTGMTSGAAALARLSDPAAKVSAHYLVAEDGQIVGLVDEAKRAWHAGLSSWRGRTRLNDVSIGIEIVNPGHDWGLRAFPDAQIAGVIRLTHDILARHPIPARRILGHSDIAPLRKRDPGPLFPWARLADAGVGLWPELAAASVGRARPPLQEAQDLLRRWGYGIEATGSLDAPTAAATAAFQTRFRPRRIDGVFDAECAALIQDLLAR